MENPLPNANGKAPLNSNSDIKLNENDNERWLKIRKLVLQKKYSNSISDKNVEKLILTDIMF